MSLADLGATVWKIENIDGGDDTRAWSVPNYKGVSTYYLCANRGKHSIALDLKSDEGRRIVRELATRADVVVENFRAGTADRLGVGYDDLRALNPALIYCSISGYGQTGSEADRPGYDFVMQAESGIMSVTGTADGPPQRLGVAFTDVVAGMVATQSILAALYQRRDTSAGQYIDIALIDASLNMLINVGAGFLNTGIEAKRFGNAHPTLVPYQLFDTTDGSFALAVGNDRMFRDLCRLVIGRPELALDARFETAHQRALHRDPLISVLTEIFAQHSTGHWLAACRAASVPAGQVRTVAEALQHPSVVERGGIQHLLHPELGAISLVAPAHGIAAQKNYRPKPPPLLGEDTVEILESVLGFDTARISGLEAIGAIGVHSGEKEPKPAS